MNVIKELPENKATPINDIPLKVMKNLNQIYSGKLTDILNSCLRNCNFPSKLKIADITPIFKKGNCNDKENYRPVSLLPRFLKVFERLLFNQIKDF